MTTTNTEPESPDTDLVTLEEPAAMPGLFGTNDPELAVNKAVQVSDVLAGVIRDKKLAVPIGGKEHVLVEGWTLLGSLLGVFPVTVWSHQLDDGWEVIFLPPLEDFPSGDPVADATRMNAVIEQGIREMPEQYFWVHRRFKSRPEGEPGLY